jgi:ribonuclease J
MFYSGDLRAHGRKATLFEHLVTHPPANVDALLLEGSSLGRLNDGQHFPSESDIEAKLAQIFSVTDGLAMIHTSAQNIDRIVSILRACRRTGRRLIIDLYTAAILEATGNENIPQSNWQDLALFVPQAQRVQIKQNAWFDLLKRHASNRIYIEHMQQAAIKSALLFRPLHRFDLERGKCLQGAVYIYSQWEGYWEQGAYDSIREWLARHNIPRHSIHTSGHACIADLKRLAASMDPRKVIPIHSFMPERYPDLFSNVEMHNDGEWWEV